ncbi:AAA family ATPase [Methylorubrum extorquens]|uniref:AAA family ATPase n=1 Tax=Methylorubrum extorquens TaxID=408 RepID=UPI00209E1D29|nr:AAA family ATPase [Methylorubrum extorquens]MCP1540138.1 hypothetical protein [Methylorubrum extorquens]
MSSREITCESIKGAFGGSINGAQVRIPAIGRPPTDRTVSIRPDPQAPNGYLLHCFRPEDDPIQHRQMVDREFDLEWSPRQDADRARSAAAVAQKKAPSVCLADVPLPDMTPKVKRGLQNVGQPEPPRIAGELPGRRHAYHRDGQAVRFKIKKTKGQPWIDFYRVRDPATERVGWQAQKPEGFVPLPYVGATNPFDPDLGTEVLFWVEGEKDVDTLSRLGLPAFTFGSASDVPEGASELVRGRDVVILSDNDGSGRIGTRKKLEACVGFATRVRFDGFPEMPEGEDVTDWMEAGGTVEALWQRIEALNDTDAGGDQSASDAPQTGEATPVGEAQADRPPITATPFAWVVPEAIPPRAWVYGRHYIRRFITTTIAPGGVGKSSLGIAEALAIATGRPILGIKPVQRARVWIWNGEDPLEEMQRRIVAACLHHNIRPEEIAGWLFVDSGRTSPLVVVTQTRAGITITEPVVAAVKATIIDRGIGVVIIDPFVSCHEVQENDNVAINTVATVWAQIADETGCAIDLVHHARKGSGGEVTVEDGRGASALNSKARSARALNPMTSDEAEKADVENRRLHFRTFDGKANLAPPSDESIWFRLVSVPLGNGTPERPEDHVGVVEAWKWPNAFDGVSLTNLQAVQHRVSDGRYRESSQSKEWVGYVVAEVLRLDADKKADLAKIKALLKTWIANGALQVVEETDAKGMKRPFVRVGEWAH